jgi:ferredoxin-thioredoxin reductase catalytic chain
MKEKKLSDVITFLDAVRKNQNLILNPDKRFVEEIASGLMENYNTAGYFGCPCRESWNNRKKDRDIFCPCDYCKPDIKEFGQCYCGLFVSEDVAANKKEVSSIPDRRDEDLYP